MRAPLPEPHLKARNSEAPRSVAVGGGWHHEGAVGDVLLVELHRHLVVAWGLISELINEGVFTDEGRMRGRGWQQWGVAAMGDALLTELHRHLTEPWVN